MDMRETRSAGDPPDLRGPLPVVERPPELVLKNGDEPVLQGPAVPAASVADGADTAVYADTAGSVDTAVSAGVSGTRSPARTWPSPVLWALGAVLLAAVGAAALVLALRGGGDVSAVPVEAPGAGTVAAAEDGVRLILPPEVVAGVPTQVVVQYAGGAGAFGGATEEWGDGVGAGSQSAPGCAGTTGGSGDRSGDPTPGEAGIYRTSHLWAEPGTYPVTISVTTYTCVGGVAKETTATVSVPVTVVAPSP